LVTRPVPASIAVVGGGAQYQIPAGRPIFERREQVRLIEAVVRAVVDSRDRGSRTVEAGRRGFAPTADDREYAATCEAPRREELGFGLLVTVSIVEPRTSSLS
jgi:hypothetical protein